MNGAQPPLRHLPHSSLDNLKRAQRNRKSYEFGENVDVDGESLWEITIGIICASTVLWCAMSLIILLVILYITVRPFSKYYYRKLATNLGSASFIDAMTLLLPKTRIYLTGDSEIPVAVGTSILICNHIMDGDWLSIFFLGRCIGLRGSVKVFLRNECLNVQSQKRIPNKNENSSNSAFIKRSELVNQSTLVRCDTNPTSISKNDIHNSGSSSGSRKSSFFVSLVAQALHTLLDFPILSGENNYIEERDNLFSLLKSFAETQVNPVHLLLFPEAWSLHGTKNRKSVLNKSNDFAKREGRPQLKQLLLPRTTGFNACLESLREAGPVVYDITMAHEGYDGLPSCSCNVPNSTMMEDVSLRSLWKIFRKSDHEIYVRIKRYSMEEVLRDASWLDKQWAEKDRLLSHFSRHKQFPVDNRGFCRHREFVPGDFQVENAIIALFQLMMIPFSLPVLLFLTIPLFWVSFWIWIIYQSYKKMNPSVPQSASLREGRGTHTTQYRENGGSVSDTPFVPATPFGSPSMRTW